MPVNRDFRDLFAALNDAGADLIRNKEASARPQEIWWTPQRCAQSSSAQFRDVVARQPLPKVGFDHAYKKDAQVDYFDGEE